MIERERMHRHPVCCRELSQSCLIRHKVLQQISPQPPHDRRVQSQLLAECFEGGAVEEADGRGHGGRVYHGDTDAERRRSRETQFESLGSHRLDFHESDDDAVDREVDGQSMIQLTCSVSKPTIPPRQTPTGTETLHGQASM